MNEEEKKAIEIIKNITEKDLLDCWDYGEKEFKAIQIILNLIDEQQNKIASQEKQIKLMQGCDLAKVIKKQQKEIEELKSQLDFIGEQNKHIDKLQKEIDEWQKAYIRENNYWLKFRNKINKIANNDKDCSDNEVIKAVKELKDKNTSLQKEIEERNTRLQEEINENCKLKTELYGNSISKNKIKEKINYYDERGYIEIAGAFKLLLEE